jgi:arylsulfatase A-like enzyme
MMARILLLAVVSLPCLVAVVRADDPPRPNIVFVLIDDMGVRDIAANGSRFFETPQIDRLAAEGMRFTDSYAACPVCSPTRFSIMAGQYPARGHLTNFIAGDRWPDNASLKPITWQPWMTPEQVTLAETLQGAGYATACIGKWHLNFNGQDDPALKQATQPKAQGFDVAVAGAPNQTDKSVAGYTDRAVDFIRANRDRPFFLYLAHHSVHIPLEATPDLIAKYEKRVRSDDPQNNPTYAGMVESVDRSVGRLMATLDDLKLADRTIFVFLSDNGGVSMEEGANTPATSNLPYRAGKGHTHEGGTRVPLIVRWPGKVAPGTTCGVPVSTVDFYPTFLAALKIPAPAKQTLDGESILPLLTQSGALQRDAIFWHYPHYSNQGGLPSGAIRQGNDKLIEQYEDGRLELYNLADDPGEQHNLADTQPEKAAALRKKLDDWRRSVGATMPEANPAFDPTQPRYSNPNKRPDSWKAHGEPPRSGAAPGR